MLKIIFFLQEFLGYSAKQAIIKIINFFFYLFLFENFQIFNKVLYLRGIHKNILW